VVVVLIITIIIIITIVMKIITPMRFFEITKIITKVKIGRIAVTIVVFIVGIYQTNFAGIPLWFVT